MLNILNKSCEINDNFENITSYEIECIFNAFDKAFFNNMLDKSFNLNKIDIEFIVDDVIINSKTPEFFDMMALCEYTPHDETKSCSYQIIFAKKLFLNLFTKSSNYKYYNACGLVITTRKNALLHTFAHELVHLCQYIYCKKIYKQESWDWKKNITEFHDDVFNKIVFNLFNHTASTHLFMPIISIQQDIKYKRYDNAIDKCNRILEHNPYDGHIYHFLGISLYQLKRLNDAIISYYKSLIINNMIDVHWELGNIFYNNKYFGKAIIEYQCLLNIDKNDKEANKKIIDTFRILSMINEQISSTRIYIHMLINRDEIHASNYSKLGNLFMQTGDTGKAIIEFKKASNLLQEKLAQQESKTETTELTNVNTALKNAEEIISNLKELDKWYREYGDYNTENRDNYYNKRGNIYAELNNLKYAIFLYKKSLKINPNNVETLYNLGILYKKQFNKEEALKLFNEIKRINPDHILAKYEIDNIDKNILPAHIINSPNFN
jgi:tetratricopeptide (TPR) repeat protein